MPLVSVVTAVHAPSAAPFLDETAESISALTLPPGWELEWVVQEDGAGPVLADFFAAVPFARYEANGHQYGTALTRNLALARTRGVLTQALDADDVLLPGALATLIPRFVEHRIHWAIGQADDLMPDGTRRAYPSRIPFGLMRAGQVNAWAAEAGGNWEVHAAAVLLRTASLRALGGWVGIPGDADLAMFAALAEVTDGWYDEALTWLYRHHAAQMHRDEAVAAHSEASRRMVLQRVRAVSGAGLRFAPEAATGFDAPADAEHVGPLAKDTTLPGAEAARAG